MGVISDHFQDFGAKCLPSLYIFGNFIVEGKATKQGTCFVVAAQILFYHLIYLETKKWRVKIIQFTKKPGRISFRHLMDGMSS
jgi:hypothetical protein